MKTRVQIVGLNEYARCGLRYRGRDVRVRDAVLIGASELAGRPISNLVLLGGDLYGLPENFERRKTNRFRIQIEKISRKYAYLAC